MAAPELVSDGVQCSSSGTSAYTGPFSPEELKRRGDAAHREVLAERDLARSHHGQREASRAPLLHHPGSGYHSRGGGSFPNHRSSGHRYDYRNYAPHRSWPSHSQGSQSAYQHSQHSGYKGSRGVGPYRAVPRGPRQGSKNPTVDAKRPQTGDWRSGDGEAKADASHAESGRRPDTDR